MSVYSSNKFSKSNVNNAWNKIFKFVPENSNVLDLGCSSGNLGEALKKEKKAKVIGVDIDEADLKEAENKLDQVHMLNLEKDDLDFLGKFDVVIMADVVEHLVDPVSALKKISRLIKPDGVLVFSIPNMANVTTRIELLKGGFKYKDFGLLDKTHIHFYDKLEVDGVFKEANFQITHTDCTLREIPEIILEKELETLGIKITPKLKKVLYSEQAITYQFIGSAKIVINPKTFKIETTSPLDSISIYIDELNEHFRKEIVARDKEIIRLNGDVDKLQDTLQRVYQSKGWKALNKVNSIKKKIT